jgi:hypothetical protein
VKGRGDCGGWGRGWVEGMVRWANGVGKRGLVVGRGGDREWVGGRKGVAALS